MYGQGEPTASEGALIELLEQEAAAGHGYEVADYVNKTTICIP